MRSSAAFLFFSLILGACAYLGDELGTLPHPRSASSAAYTAARPVKFGTNYFTVGDPNKMCNDACLNLVNSYLFILFFHK